jgi:hypothetical protein
MILLIYFISGLIVAIIASVIGLRMIYRAVIKDTAFMNGTFKAPTWLILCIGILMQSLLAIYIYLWIKGGTYDLFNILEIL